jgi:Rv0078B-related antitoxin
MTPQTALDQQIDRYRKMSGEERLSIALNLHELACEVTREGIRHQHPGLDEGEVNRLLRERLALARHL